MNIPQPTGELLIALRIRDEMKKRLNIDIDAINLTNGMEITHEILKGFVVTQVDKAEKYI